MSILFFDTETTGLPEFKSFNGYYDYSEIEKYEKARVIQLAYIICQPDGTILKKINHLIKPNGFTIENSQFHGISNEIANKNGLDIDIVMDEFLKDVAFVEVIVGHNVLFDRHVVASELYRISKNHEFFFLYKSECTQDLSMPLCKLTRFNGSPKYPKLSEAVQILLNEEPKGLHNAMCDVIYCMRVYFACLKHIK